MLPKRDLSHINNLKQLREAKLLAVQEIQDAEFQLDYIFSQMPMRALGGAFGFAAGLVTKGIKDTGKSALGASTEQIPNEAFSLKSGLQTLGTELAVLGFSKIVAKLLSKKK